jgi:hypothetical protein
MGGKNGSESGSYIMTGFGIGIVELPGPTAIHLLQEFVDGSRKNLSWNT